MERGKLATLKHLLQVSKTVSPLTGDPVTGCQWERDRWWLWKTVYENSKKKKKKHNVTLEKGGGGEGEWRKERGAPKTLLIFRLLLIIQEDPLRKVTSPEEGKGKNQPSTVSIEKHLHHFHGDVLMSRLPKQPGGNGRKTRMRNWTTEYFHFRRHQSTCSIISFNFGVSFHPL